MTSRALQALGRLKVGAMNKTEQAYAATLDLRKVTGEVVWYKFEGLKFRLADNTFYTPEFAVMLASDALEVHEVKGFGKTTREPRSKSRQTYIRCVSSPSRPAPKRMAAAGRLRNFECIIP